MYIYWVVYPSIKKKKVRDVFIFMSNSRWSKGVKMFIEFVIRNVMLFSCKNLRICGSGSFGKHNEGGCFRWGWHWLGIWWMKGGTPNKAHMLTEGEVPWTLRILQKAMWWMESREFSVVRLADEYT